MNTDTLFLFGHNVMKDVNNFQIKKVLPQSVA